MLNELKTLADSIQSAGFSGKNWDDKYKEFKTGNKSPCFIVSVSLFGEIEDIRFVEPEKARQLRTWEESNGHRFPCFNFIPFYNLHEDGNAPLSKSQKNSAINIFIAEFLKAEEFPKSVGPIQWVDRTNANSRTAKCLGSVADKFFEIVTKNNCDDDPLVQFKKGISALRSVSIAETVNQKILHYIRSHLTPDMVTQKDTPTIWSLLFCRTPDVVLFFDVSSPTGFPIASEYGTKAINTRLLAEQKPVLWESEIQTSDAFGITVFPKELSATLPEVKLPIVGNVILRCMNGEYKCQSRYGHVDADSFPIGSEARRKMKTAIGWISSSEREGKTWAIAGAKELVFAYPKTMLSSPPLLARLLGNGKSSTMADKVQEARFEKYAEKALLGMKKLALNADSNAEIEVFAIKKADVSSKRAKVVFYRNYCFSRLETAVSDWLTGAKNIPPILLHKWPSKEKGEKALKGTKPVPCEFYAPLPLAATGLIYTMWSQDGNSMSEPKFRDAFLYKGYPVFDGLELFLGESVATGLAERMLSLLLQGAGSLCTEAGNLARKKGVISNARAAAYLETSLPLLGILLHKLNRTKDVYMEKSPYLIGKFLNLADGLHAVWCRNVRENQLPPQLLGSSLFATFQLNPVQGFANAGMRMKPYLDWAKTNQTKDIALSRWYVGEFGRVTAAIKEAGIPVRLSDADKAEMLLGYLSATGKNVETDSALSEKNDTQNTN